MGVPFIDELTQMLHRLIIGCFALIGGSLRGFAEHAGVRIAGGPTGDFHRTLPVKINVSIGRIQVVEGNVIGPNEILTHVTLPPGTSPYRM